MINTKTLRQLRTRFARNCDSERGTTLIEMLIVVIIISLVSLGILYLMTALLNTQAGANQSVQQNSSSQDIRSELSALSSGLSASNIGLNDGTGRTTSISLAGDTVNFKLPDQGMCARVYYVARLQQLKAATSTTAQCSTLTPVRGPNQVVPAHTGCAAPCYSETDSSNPYYDPVLDGVVSSFVVASNVVNSSTGSVDPPNTSNAIFTYLDKSNATISTVNVQADSSSVYAASPTIQSKLAAISVNLYLAGSNSASSSLIRPAPFRQRLAVIGSN